MTNQVPETLQKNPLNGHFLPGNTLSHGLTNSGRPRLWSEEEVNIEAKELLKYANKPDSIVLASHYASRDYTYDDVFDWCKRNSEFSKALKIAKQIVGARREAGALNGKYSEGIVSKTMANYDPEHRAMMREQAQKIDINQSKDGLQISIVNYQADQQ